MKQRKQEYNNFSKKKKGAWNRYWTEYIRQREGEGVIREQSVPSREKPSDPSLK